MFEIFGLVIAVTAVGTLARGRGTNPIVAGTIAAAGWVLLRFLAPAFIPPGDARLWLIPGAWAWVALVAGYVRFVVGAGRPKADSKWSCSNCHFLNNKSAIVCEACQQPWQSRG